MHVSTSRKHVYSTNFSWLKKLFCCLHFIDKAYRMAAGAKIGPAQSLLVLICRLLQRQDQETLTRCKRRLNETNGLNLYKWFTFKPARVLYNILFFVQFALPDVFSVPNTNVCIVLEGCKHKHARTHTCTRALIKQMTKNKQNTMESYETKVFMRYYNIQW